MAAEANPVGEAESQNEPQMSAFRRAIQPALESISAIIMKHAGGPWGLFFSFALCCVNVFTIVLTPVIVPFLISAHASRGQGSIFSFRKQAVSFWSALGAAVGSMALHWVTEMFGKDYLHTILPEHLINPTGQVAYLLETYGAIGVGLSGLLPGPIQPAVIIGALLKCNILAVGICMFLGRYPKNFLLFESAGTAIHSAASAAKRVSTSSPKGK
eukprot:gnl/TRDRNA2_/TRDRNA2_124625_c0_seq1.p1 gnl/TRDRNA2_/TRDRNA2_124625_c0~~gnl/TRDRNA2_/TRDRNA2_124625_c0_seq1.p1  ORF type:complete len:214 (-),score=20.49 gnl/TRDRNA2_/TRDRNA2_124625_c0_seq1:32-673(-)